MRRASVRGLSPTAGWPDSPGCFSFNVNNWAPWMVLFGGHWLMLFRWLS